jgi:hypothetical protein
MDVKTPLCRIDRDGMRHVAQGQLGTQVVVVGRITHVRSLKRHKPSRIIRQGIRLRRLIQPLMRHLALYADDDPNPHNSHRQKTNDEPITLLSHADAS